MSHGPNCILLSQSLSKSRMFSLVLRKQARVLGSLKLGKAWPPGEAPRAGGGRAGVPTSRRPEAPVQRGSGRAAPQPRPFSAARASPPRSGPPGLLVLPEEPVGARVSLGALRAEPSERRRRATRSCGRPDAPTRQARFWTRAPYTAGGCPSLEGPRLFSALAALWSLPLIP